MPVGTLLRSGFAVTTTHFKVDLYRGSPAPLPPTMGWPLEIKSNGACIGAKRYSAKNRRRSYDTHGVVNCLIHDACIYLRPKPVNLQRSFASNGVGVTRRTAMAARLV